MGFHMGIGAFKWLSKLAMAYVDESPTFFFIKHFLICGGLVFIVMAVKRMLRGKKIRSIQDKLAVMDGSKAAALQKEIEELQNEQIQLQRKREQLEKLV